MPKLLWTTMKETASISSSTKPPLKRRKLLRSSTPPSSSSTDIKSSLISPSPIASGSKISGLTVPICTSCHRACPTGNTVQCSICSNTICSVCSRRCTHSAVSQPPTPNLTWSPSPSPSICESPRRSRSVLSLVNASNTNLPSLPEVPPTPTQNTIFGKRRKIVDEDEAPNALASNGPSKDRLLLSPGESVDDIYLSREEFGPGCGRLVCRKCCYEDVPSNTTTCLECYGSHSSNQ